MRVSWTARAVLVIVVLALGARPAGAQGTDQYKGRPLVEVLRALQARGLRIVYTSATVTPDVIVQIEPHATAPRKQLDELLAPLALEAKDGPRGIIQIVHATPRRPDKRAAVTGTIEGWIVDASTAAPIDGVVVRLDGVNREARTDAAGHFRFRHVATGARALHMSATGYRPSTHTLHVADGATAAVTSRLSPADRVHKEYVAVRGPWPYRHNLGVAAETSLERHHWAQLSGGLADDPLRSVQSLPRVTAVDDFRSEFAVRGSPFRQVDLVIDGMSTQMLQHTVLGRGATGSLAMFSSHVLEEATLRAGAYPRRYGDRLGPQLDLALREGSRDGFTLRGAVGGTHALLLGEGPLPGAARGSWIAAARQSLLEWPAGRGGSTRTPFGFSDGFAKVVYDVAPNQQMALTVLRGTSSVEVEENLAPDDLGNGMNRVSALNLSWRSRLGSSLVLMQRAYLVQQRFLNQDQSGGDRDHGSHDEMVYRGSLARPIGRGLFEVGAQVGRSRLDDVLSLADTDAQAIQGSAWVRSAYAHMAWSVAPSLTVSPGVRITTSTLAPRPTVTPWVLGEWAFRPGWTLSGSAGVSHQLPELAQALRALDERDLRPERARHLDLALEQRLTDAIRWQVTLFSRHEDDILREPDTYPRLVNDVLAAPQRRYVNALEGRSRGIELLVDRRSPIGVSGWASYSYGKTRQTDVTRQETFWADFDQRHTLNVSGAYRFSTRTGVGATFRAGSNFPISAYVADRDGKLFVGAERNQLRLPMYARLDLRADREVELFGHRVTLFTEAWNALNRVNVGLAHGSVNPATGETTGLTDRLSRRRIWVGAFMDF